MGREMEAKPSDGKEEEDRWMEGKFVKDLEAMRGTGGKKRRNGTKWDCVLHRGGKRPTLPLICIL